MRVSEYLGVSIMASMRSQQPELAILQHIPSILLRKVVKQGPIFIENPLWPYHSHSKPKKCSPYGQVDIYELISLFSEGSQITVCYFFDYLMQKFYLDQNSKAGWDIVNYNLFGMSYIIDNRCGKYFNKHKSRKRFRKERQQQRALDEPRGEDLERKELVCSVIPRFVGTAGFQIKFGKARRYVLEPLPLIFGLMAGMELRLENYHGSNFLKMSIIDQNGQLFRFQFHHHRLLLNKQFALNYKLTLPLTGRVGISMQTGEVKIVFYLDFRIEEQSITGQSLSQRRNQFNKFLQRSVEEGKYVINLIKLLMGREGYQINCSRDVETFQSERRSKITALNRYYQMLPVRKIELDCLFNKKKALKYENQQKTMQSIKELLAHRKEVQSDMQKMSGMYHIYDRQIEQYKSAVQYEIIEEELQKLGKFIDMPYLQRPGILSESTQNCILVKNINNLKLMPINSGGFSSIYTAETEFWIMPNSKVASNPPNLPPIRKFLAFKRALPHSKDQIKQKDRNFHEKLIIQKLKNSSSVFLNTYYTPINKPNPFQADIIMEYIPFSNIGEYIRMNKTILSLHTKLHLGFMIAQALRSLKSYEIVHVDLKPSNILIYCNLFLKLIDFGEAYHPQICKKDYSPGFSVPYSSPQVHRSPLSITSKSDLFSFGIIFFELLFGYTPINFFRDESLKKLKSEQYLKSWLFVPESDESLGQTSIIPKLMMLISHCLSSDESSRPEINFVSIMLRQCFEVLH